MLALLPMDALADALRHAVKMRGDPPYNGEVGRTSSLSTLPWKSRVQQPLRMLILLPVIDSYLSIFLKIYLQLNARCCRVVRKNRWWVCGLEAYGAGTPFVCLRVCSSVCSMVRMQIHTDTSLSRSV